MPRRSHPSFTKRDYKYLAAFWKVQMDNIRADIKWVEREGTEKQVEMLETERGIFEALIKDFATHLKGTNPAYNRIRFLEACGLDQ